MIRLIRDTLALKICRVVRWKTLHSSTNMLRRLLTLQACVVSGGWQKLGPICWGTTIAQVFWTGGVRFSDRGTVYVRSIKLSCFCRLSGGGELLPWSHSSMCGCSRDMFLLDSYLSTLLVDTSKICIISFLTSNFCFQIVLL